LNISRVPLREADNADNADEGKKVKIKASHTRYLALGPEMIPVYRQSACR